MSSTQSSSVSLGLIGADPAAPAAATRTMPTAISCTAMRFGAVTAGLSVYTMYPSWHAANRRVTTPTAAATRR